MSSELAEAVQSSTAYGDLGKLMSFVNGLQVPYICPWAFLSLLSQKSWMYAKFLAECRGDKACLGIMLYTDEVVPGRAIYVFCSRVCS